ncbi:MAG: right-handed parallel beta-helix repeat-containing protein [Anaerolineales bacterium]|nr:right-handed parallel beta-helix repeat-containing protein [Anaerolineales bacterium]
MKRILTPHARKILLLCSTFAAVALVMFDTAKAENIVVTTTADNGPGSLRQAILDANASPEDDVITVAAQGTILLASPLPPISSSVTVIGPGTDLLAISGSYLYRVFEIESSTTVTLTNLTIKNGKTPVGEGGAGIKSTGNIHLFDLDIQGNFAVHDGAGVYLESGTAEISHSRVYSNISASGAGIHAANSIVQITDSEFASNGGSAISSYLTTLSMSNTAISANLGSGILSQDGVLNVDNSQITGNFDSGLLIDGSTFSIQNSFIADNHANRGGGIELPRHWYNHQYDDH